MTHTQTANSDWTFLHACDSHLGTPRSYRFRPAINKRWSAIKEQMASLNPEFLLHGGDLTRDGDTHEIEYQLAREDLDTLPFPTFAIPGNMDVGNKHTSVSGTTRNWNDVELNMTSERLGLFASWFGPIHWTFLYRNVRFTGFFASVAGSGLKQECRLWQMLENIPNLPPAKHHVAVMHYWPFMEQPDEPEWDITNPDEYDNWYFSLDREPRLRLMELLKAASVEVLFCGHVHTDRPQQEIDGLKLYRSRSAGNSQQLAERWHDADTRYGFHKCDVTESGIEITFVPGNDQCDEFGTFGPWGHTAVEERDYSVAEEQPPLTPS